MEWIYDDGGRAAAGFKGEAGDCFCRAVAIAAQIPYKQVYDLINEVAKAERTKYKSSARGGVYRATADKVMARLGWRWVPTMQIGQGCTVHTRADELPTGRLVLNVSQHYISVVDGVARDTYDSTRGGDRCVYGYYCKG